MPTTRSSPTPVQSPTHGYPAGESARPGGAGPLEDGHDAVLDQETVKGLYTALLSEFPEAPVAAVKPDGLFVSMPASFPIGRHPLLQGRSGLDLVTPEDRGNVIMAWDVMQAQGAARCVVHLAVDPAATRTFHFFDGRPAYGVFLHVIARLTAPTPKRRRRFVPRSHP